MTESSRQRKIAALKRLAERPGTPAEGAAARAALDRMNSTKIAANERVDYKEFDGGFSFSVQWEGDGSDAINAFEEISNMFRERQQQWDAKDFRPKPKK